MTGDVIKSFLVGLGFDVDDASLAKFNKSIASATARVSALYASINVTASAVAFGISKISESFEDLGYQYRIITPAINKAIVLRRELFRAYAAAGINIQSTVLSALRLNMSLTKTKYILDALYKSVGSRFFGYLTKQSDLFRQRIYANLPRIQAVLESVVRFIFKVIEGATALGLRAWSILTRIYDFFVKIDKATDGWSTIILGVIAAWTALNLSFLATPLGALVGLGIAILGLYDDIKTFYEGGQSLINWGSDTTKLLVGMVAILGGVAAGFYAVSAAMATWEVLEGLITAIKEFDIVLAAVEALLFVINAPIIAIVAAVSALVAVLTAADAKWKIFGGTLSGFASGIGGKILDFIGGKNVANNIAQSPNGTPSTAPTGVGPSNTRNSSQTNVNANLQTNVHVQGVPDASSVGKTVTQEQSKNIFDLVRNMQGAVKPGGIIGQ